MYIWRDNPTLWKPCISYYYMCCLPVSAALMLEGRPRVRSYYYIILYHVISYYCILYYIMLCYVILYYVTLYYMCLRVQGYSEE